MFTARGSNFERCPPLPPESFLRESGSSHFRGSDAFSGPKSVKLTNKTALFALSIQYLSSTVMVMMS